MVLFYTFSTSCSALYPIRRFCPLPPLPCLPPPPPAPSSSDTHIVPRNSRHRPRYCRPIHLHPFNRLPSTVYHLPSTHLQVPISKSFPNYLLSSPRSVRRSLSLIPFIPSPLLPAASHRLSTNPPGYQRPDHPPDPAVCYFSFHLPRLPVLPPTNRTRFGKKEKSLFLPLLLPYLRLGVTRSSSLRGTVRTMVQYSLSPPPLPSPRRN
jgi:hypothetical protein